MLKIVKLRCEYMKDPIGIDVPSPRFSWQLESDAMCVVQSSFRLQVSRQDPTFLSHIWDSGTLLSDKSVHVEYTGDALLPRTRYYYRVRVKDTCGNDTGWSEAAFWETGLMDPSNWKAQWITAETGTVPYFRKEFDIHGKILSARIYATALGIYELRLNGSRIGDSYFAPGWTNYKKRVQYQTYDITDMLKDGTNAIGAVVGKGWYAGDLAWKNDRIIYGDRQALLLQMHMIYTDGREEVLISDTGWKTSVGPILMSEIYHGETYDARLEEQDWDQPRFDDVCWASAKPFEYTAGSIVSQENEPVSIMDEIAPVGIIKTPKGETVLDFGQNMVGWVRFNVKGPKGTEVVIKHAEVLDQDGNFYTVNLRNAKQTITYILKGEGTESFQPHFTYQGFRFVMLENYPGDPDPADFRGMVLYSGMEATGYFKCSDDLVNKLQHNILWSQKGNFLDIPTDCPQRDERLGWTGDAQMFIGTACFNMKTDAFFTKWLRDLYSEQTIEKGVPFVIPNMLSESNVQSSSAWGDAAAICPWTIYRCYDDKRLLNEQYDSIRLWVEYIRRQGDNEYLWNTGFHFGDWLGLDAKSGNIIGATPVDLISTAFYAYSADILAKSAEVLGKTDDMEIYSELHDKIAENFRMEFMTPNGRLASPTQTAHVLALMFGLVEEKHKKRTIETLVKLIEENKCRLETGFVGTPYLCFVLSNNGYNDLAYKLLLQKDYPSWLYPVTKGATTIWEHWDGIREDGSYWDGNMNSFNHYAYGSVGDWLYRVVAGISEGLPGYKHINIKPMPGEGLDCAEARYDSVYGPIVSSWTKTKDHFKLDIEIPANTTATVTLPAAGTCIQLSGPAAGLIFDIGSGRYSFSCGI
jgi:alpha-L-rhamnosidase